MRALSINFSGISIISFSFNLVIAVGEKSKLFVNGDPSQIDITNKNQSGLVQSQNILKGIKEISIVNFDQNDVIRHPLVAKIVEAYKKNTNDKG